MEERMRKAWNYIPREEDHDEKECDVEDASQNEMMKSLQKMAKESVKGEMQSEVMVDEGGRPRYQESWIGAIVHEIFGKHPKTNSES